MDRGMNRTGMPYNLMVCACFCLQVISPSLLGHFSDPTANRLRLMQSVRCLSGVLIRNEADPNEASLRVSVYVEDGFHLAYPRGLEGVTGALRVESNGHFELGEFTLVSTPIKDEFSNLRHEGLIELEAKVKKLRPLSVDDFYFGHFTLNVFSETQGISFSQKFLVLPLLPLEPKTR
jgi:hypothetical protein